MKHFRTAMGISQEAMARRLGIDASTLARWESGRRKPEGEHLAKIEDMLRPPFAN